MREPPVTLLAAEQLRAQIRPPADIVILDCRYDLADPQAGARAFAGGHIPGARYASLHRDLSAPLGRYGGRHPMPSAEQFQQFARGCGIGTDTQVIVYDDNRLAFAARAWFLLHYFGHRRIALLDGGLKAWREAGLPLEEGEDKEEREEGEKRGKGNFTAAPRPELLVHHDHLSENLESAPWQLIDARDTKRFAGHEEPIDPVAGHIPGAVNKPWQGITNEDGTLKSRDQLRGHWQDIPSDQAPLNYCGSGVTACVNFLSLHLIGRTDALLYPGSWSDWCAHMLYPSNTKQLA